VKVGDTLKVDMAEIFGVGLQGVLKNAEYLTFLKSKNFHVPSPPPKPVLRVSTTNHEVSLDWTLCPTPRTLNSIPTEPGRFGQKAFRRIPFVQEYQGAGRAVDPSRRV